MQTNDQSKIDIISKLVKEGAIDFVEALKLMETEKEYIYIPNYTPTILPYYPIWEVQPPYQITCDYVTNPQPSLFSFTSSIN